MGAVFFFTLLPIIITILGIIIAMAVVGIAVFVVGVGGAIVSATAVNNMLIKRVSLVFFTSLVLLGISCLMVLLALFIEVYFFIAPMLVAIGAAVVAFGIGGIIKAVKIDQMAAKVILVVLLSVSSLIGAIVFAFGILMFALL